MSVFVLRDIRGLFIDQVADIFGKCSIVPHISKQGRAIYLYRADAVARYLSIFGTSNERIKSVFENWRKPHREFESPPFRFVKIVPALPGRFW